MLQACVPTAGVRRALQKGDLRVEIPSIYRNRLYSSPTQEPQRGRAAGTERAPTAAAEHR
jgi:hypothetical protein